MSSADALRLRVEFSGGLETLFGDVIKHSIEVPRLVDAEQRPADLRYLIAHLRKSVLVDQNRPELFVQGATVRPGILVLVNDADWELEGGLAYQLCDNDEIVFISTLHGG